MIIPPATDDDLTAIRERHGRATGGVWFCHPELPGVYGAHPRIMNTVRLIAVFGNAESAHKRQEQWEADAEFVFKAHQDIPALLARIEADAVERKRLEEALRAAEASLDEAVNGPDGPKLMELAFALQAVRRALATHQAPAAPTVGPSLAEGEKE